VGEDEKKRKEPGNFLRQALQVGPGRGAKGKGDIKNPEIVLRSIQKKRGKV